MGKHRGRHEIPREEIAGVAIREVRPGYFMADFQRAGKRVRKCFKTLDAAKVWAGAKKIEIINKGVEALNLSDRLRSQALEASRRLEGTGYTIMECVAEYLRRHPVTVGETFRATCDKYLIAMRETGRRPVSIYDKGIKFSLLCKVMGDTATAAVDEADIRAWAEAHGGSKETIEGNIGHARNLLRFYERGGKLKDRTTRDETPPVTWSADIVKGIMHTAETLAPDTVAPLALLFFAGLRPHEVLRLNWEMIDMEGGIIRLTGEATKTRTMRNVLIAPNLKAWLTRYRKQQGPLVPHRFRFRKHRERIMDKCGLNCWPGDIARHTFATMHYNAHQNAAATMAMLGHFDNPQMFLRHYKGVPVTAIEAAAFWKIRPTTKAAEIVEFIRAAS